MAFMGSTPQAQRRPARIGSTTPRAERREHSFWAMRAAILWGVTLMIDLRPLHSGQCACPPSLFFYLSTERYTAAGIRNIGEFRRGSSGNFTDDKAMVSNNSVPERRGGVEVP